MEHLLDYERKIQKSEMLNLWMMNIGKNIRITLIKGNAMYATDRISSGYDNLTGTE